MEVELKVFEQGRARRHLDLRRDLVFRLQLVLGLGADDDQLLAERRAAGMSLSAFMSPLLWIGTV
ncbi:hypothetical protein ETQ85_14330 [Zoogloea oleivorans]|jgi:hypothetical protein|uniref:Uncharacterized protein n=1 Tax=Zoogloea oleivorans TaxID=1552750 RepID=A0A6C2CLW7_9RHOO|nr:hypothetical protein [Zoogloea oleivorans]TYC55197.1 hypothetical protein ETQ85_14330 [Zoogloea oleivorans]